MLKRFWIAMVALCVFVAPARAELKVDIIAGAAEPISIAIQKFETGDGVLVEPNSCDLHRGDLKDRNGYLELHSRSCALHTLIDYESVSHSGLVTGKSLDLGCTGDLGPRIQPGGLRLGPLAGTVCAGSSLWTSSL